MQATGKGDTRTTVPRMGGGVSEFCTWRQVLANDGDQLQQRPSKPSKSGSAKVTWRIKVRPLGIWKR